MTIVTVHELMLGDQHDPYMLQQERIVCVHI